MFAVWMEFALITNMLMFQGRSDGTLWSTVGQCCYMLLVTALRILLVSNNVASEEWC